MTTQYISSEIRKSKSGDIAKTYEYPNKRKNSEGEQECINSSDNESENSEEISKHESSIENSTEDANQSTSKKNPVLKISGIILLLVLVAVSVINSLLSLPSESVMTDIISFKEKFPTQRNETWYYFEAIIDDILFLNPTRPAVFLLLYEGNDSLINDLVHHFALRASTKLETNEKYIDVDKYEFHRKETISDYGYLINKYKSELLKKQVMVVRDLQNISGTVAQAFHSFCDEITPLVDRVVYLFTLKVDSIVGKEEYIAEKSLTKSWHDLDNDILIPLITRVTSTVMKVFNENILK